MKKHYSIPALILAAILLLSACGAAQSTTDAYYYGAENSSRSDIGAAAPEEMAYENPRNYGSDGLYTATASTQDSKNSGQQSLAQDNQKLIKTLSAVVETTEFDASLQKLSELVFSTGGYIESSTVGGQSYNTRISRSARYVLRVPAHQLDAAENALGQLGNVTSLTSQVSDVTLSWADTESRIKALEAQRDSLLSMMEKAETLTDLLQLQDHLADVEYRLESYASQMRMLENHVSYSSIRLDIQEVKIYTEKEPDSFGDKLSQSFKNSLESLGGFFESLAIFLVGNILIILCWVIFLVLMVLVIRAFIKKSHKKKVQNKP